MDSNQDVYVCTLQNGTAKQMTVYVAALWHVHVYSAFKKISGLENTRIVHSKKGTQADLERITSLLEGDVAETVYVDVKDNPRFAETLTFVFPENTLTKKA